MHSGGRRVTWLATPPANVGLVRYAGFQAQKAKTTENRTGGGGGGCGCAAHPLRPADTWAPTTATSPSVSSSSSSLLGLGPRPRGGGGPPMRLAPAAELPPLPCMRPRTRRQRQAPHVSSDPLRPRVPSSPATSCGCGCRGARDVAARHRPDAAQEAGVVVSSPTV